MIKREV